MSVQTKITTRKSGKETKRYYATVYDSVAKKSLCGPLREKRSEALTDESKIRREMETQRKDGASSKVQSKTLTIAELYAAWQPHARRDRENSNKFRPRARFQWPAATRREIQTCAHGP